MYYEQIDPNLRVLVGKNEKVLWYGKPDKKCFILEGIFNPLLPFALIWGLIDFTVIGGIFYASSHSKSGPIGAPLLFFIGFFAIHLMPVWIYLFGCLTTFIRYRNTSYIVTDQAVYISDGVISRHFNRKPFAELNHIDLHIGIIDRMIGVGDVVFDCQSSNASMYVVNGRRVGAKLSICDIREYQEVYNLIRDLQIDVYSDVQYPNAYRPEYNPGYKTKYEKAEKPDFQEEYFRSLDKNNK